MPKQSSLILHYFAGVLSAVTILCFILSCNKKDMQFNNITESKTNIAFFQNDDVKDIFVKDIIDKIKEQDKRYNIVTKFLALNGQPLWTETITLNNTAGALALIPFAKQNSIHGFIVATKSGNHYRLKTYNIQNLPFYGYDTRPENYSISKVQTIINYFNYKIYKINKFKITDIRQIPEEKRNHIPSNQISKLYGVYKPQHYPAALSNTRQLDSENSMNSLSEQYCIVYDEEVEIWYDPDGDDDPCDCSGNEYYLYTISIPHKICFPKGGTGTGGGTGNGGGEGSGTGSGGGSGNGGGTGGGGLPNEEEYYWDEDCQCMTLNPWWSGGWVTYLSPTTAILQRKLSLSPREALWLENNPSDASELLTYIRNTNQSEANAIANEHLNEMINNPDYLSFVRNHQNTGSQGMAWWEDVQWLEDPQNFSLDITNHPTFEDLNAEEIILVGIYPAQAFIIKQNRDVATTVSINTGLPGPLNGKQDAFRHAFFNAINTRDVPARLIGPGARSGSDIVRLFAAAHESDTPPQLQLEKQMDLFNNEVGISYCWNCWTTSNNSIRNALLTKLNNGELKYLTPVEATPNPQSTHPNGVNNDFWHINGNERLGKHGITSITKILPTNQ